MRTQDTTTTLAGAAGFAAAHAVHYCDAAGNADYDDDPPPWSRPYPAHLRDLGDDDLPLEPPTLMACLVAQARGCPLTR